MKPYSSIIYIDSMLRLEELEIMRKGTIRKVDERKKNSTAVSLQCFLDDCLAKR